MIRALRNRNFRLYLIGQAISQTGNWFQQTAEIWLILQLTGSGTAVGVYTAVRFGPLLLFGVHAGLLTDRYDHLKLLMVTQSVYIVSVGALAISAFSASPSLALLYGTVLVRGITLAIDNPLRRSVVRDLVPDAELTNAISINSTMHTVARFIGPALAGLVLVTLGAAWCFALNATSYVAVIVSLLLMDRRLLRFVPRVEAGPGQVIEGFRYAWRNRRIRRTLIMVTVLGVFVLNTWDVILPVYAQKTFAGDARLYGFLVSLMGFGAFAGGVAGMRLTVIRGSFFRWANALLAVSFAIVAFAPVLPAAFVGLGMLGAGATAFQIAAQSRLQLEAEDVMSGRILALYSVALVGVRPVGGMISGWLVDFADPRAAFLVPGVVCAVVALSLLLTRPAPARRAEVPEVLAATATAGDRADTEAAASAIVRGEATRAGGTTRRGM
ncbi:MAG TPA: MFS transporter [Candidatus Limnocylindria bacterium]|nr:MFS transporter [Candidatus Limnocylindria bacterium]